MKTLITLTLLFSSLCFGAKYYPEKANPSDVRIVPVQSTPEPDNVETIIVFPKDNQLVSRTPIDVQIRLLGYPVGTMSDFDRKNEIYNDPMGQSMLVFVDNHHPIEIYKSFWDSLDQNNIYYKLTLNTTIPFNLSRGMHVIRAFPGRSFGEGLKGPGCFQASIFYVGERVNNLNVDLNAPYLTYNEPLETLRYPENKPLLLDFYITNAQLSSDGYKVKVLIDEKIERILTRWTPYYIYGLKKGDHTIGLQLLTPNNKVAPGLFNKVERSITID